ncbi:hypothetical protein NE237_013656 [Protea cynaroides]|uniref:Uncharacterized protein n=1 Tax=Protea cynaroides TaxID=273540 RepID=A0A9Q0H249_9MAGN|nr:hypothetical protein NE237_013656 [Protea cynaroides]
MLQERTGINLIFAYQPKTDEPYFLNRAVSRKSFTMHLLCLMTSWAVVCDVWYLEPQNLRPGETAIEFAERVRDIISVRAELLRTRLIDLLLKLPFFSGTSRRLGTIFISTRKIGTLRRSSGKSKRTFTAFSHVVLCLKENLSDELQSLNDKWTPPPRGMYSVCTDASFFYGDQIGEIGIIFRDYQAHHILAISQGLTTNSAKKGEVLAIYKPLIFAYEEG